MKMKMKMKIKVILIVSISTLFSGCSVGISGGGNIIKAIKTAKSNSRKINFIKKNKLRPIEYKELKVLLSGNTIIRNPNSNSTQILLLDKRGTNPNSGLRDIVKEIDIKKRTVVTGEWGIKAGWSYYPIFGTEYRRDLDLSKIKFEQHFFINLSKNKFFIISSKYPTTEYHIIQGHPNKLVNLSKTKNFNHSSIAGGIGLGGMLLTGIVKATKGISKTSTSSKHTPCNWRTGKSCYKILKKTSSTTYKIECTRGFKIGQINKVCVNSKAKWASGCGLSDAFAYHNNSMGLAANKWCDN